MSQNLSRSNSKKIERFLSELGQLKNSLSGADKSENGESKALRDAELGMDMVDTKLHNDELGNSASTTKSGKSGKSVTFSKESDDSNKKKQSLLSIQYVRQLSRETLKDFEESESKNAPYFTIWLILVEIALFSVMFLFHPVQHLGFTEQNITSIVWHQSISYQEVTYSQPGNPWYGPSNEVLIHHGAVFTPCMHRLEKVRIELEKARAEENRSGCCFRIAHGTCCQSLPEKCSNRTSHLLRPYPGRSSATVCGMDPDFCDDADKSDAKTDISEWKPCRKKRSRKQWPKTESLHMSCKVAARPCTYGIYQQCMFATEQFCTFLNGKHHPEAYLCSQVNPISDICGWTTASSPDEQPRQYPRLLFALFMHAGALHLFVSVVYQYYYMRHFEGAVGTYKIMLIYFISGVMSNIASAVFLPLTPYIGPNGANIGTYSFLYYHFLSNWSRYVNPWKTFFKSAVYLFLIFGLGAVFPWINNFALISGFIFGLLLTFTLSKVPDERSICQRTKTPSFRICFILLIFLSGCLLYMFLMTDGFSGKLAQVINRFNCLFGDEFCRIKTNVNIHVEDLTVRT